MEGERLIVRSSAYVAALGLLIFIFSLRVIGQLIQVLSPVPWLPPLPAWQGSTIPYPLLLAFQAAIVMVMLFVAGRHAWGKVQRRPRLGNWLLLGGSVYFLGMALRLIIGLADWSDAPWFQRQIPAFFHLVLATYLLLLAAFHLDWIGKE